MEIRNPQSAIRNRNGQSPLRVCHVITRMILGGAQENTLLTCEGLHARGHDVTLVTGPAIGPEGELLTRAQAGGYRVIVVDSMRREISPLRDRRAGAELQKILAELRPDVMHSHSSKAGILARAAAAKVGGMKIVHTIHGLAFHRYEKWWRNRVYIGLERSAARRTDAIISVADAMTAQALAAGIGTPEQYTTIYSGMEVESFIRRPDETDEVRAALRLPKNAVVVTQISRLAELKGHEFLLKVAREIPNERVCFLFVGDGRLRRQIEATIASLDLAGRFRLTGLVCPDQIPALLHASDILVHCSLREGLARALPQAMLAGLPVVSFDVDGAAEVIDSDTGILLDPKDVAGLKLAIETLAEVPALRHKLGQAGRARCREMFDHNRMVDQIEALYRRLV